MLPVDQIIMQLLYSDHNNNYYAGSDDFLINFNPEKYPYIIHYLPYILHNKAALNSRAYASRSGSKHQNHSQSGSFLLFFDIPQEKWPVHKSF